jgi:uncharacterized protein GlcG (DUF336 family)
MVIAVLDSGGHLVMLERMDGTQLGSIEGLGAGTASQARAVVEGADLRRSTRLVAHTTSPEDSRSWIGPMLWSLSSRGDGETCPSVATTL